MNYEKRREKLKQRILDSLTKGKTLTAACKKAGISRVSVNKWRVKDPEFGDRVQEYIDAKLPGNLEEPESTAPEILKLTELDRTDPSGSPTGWRPATNQHRPEKDRSMSQLVITLGYSSPERKAEILDDFRSDGSIQPWRFNQIVKEERIQQLEAERRRKARSEFDPMRYRL